MFLLQDSPGAGDGRRAFSVLYFVDLYIPLSSFILCYFRDYEMN